MQNPNTQKHLNRQRRHRRVRAKISGTAQRPRVAIFASNQHTVAQAIDDVQHRTLAAASDRLTGRQVSKTKKGTKTERASTVGAALAKALQAQQIGSVVFDTGGFAYHGRVKAVAEAVRTAGLHG